MLNYIDSLTDSITMYRLLLYYLGSLLAVAMGLSGLGVLHYNALYILLSTSILLFVCWLTNRIFSYIFSAPTNSESSLLTALILALIITPDPTNYNLLFLVAASGLAIASKYLLTIRKKHIFNPAALAVALTAIGPRQTASWWIGTAAMVPFVIVGGILITRKIRRQTMVIAFFASTTIATIAYSLASGANVMTSLHSMVFTSSLLFLGFVMLTEPLTSPPTATKQTWYGMLVGALLPPQVHVLNFYSSPELALLVGNIFSYVVSSKTKLFPTLKQKVKVANHIADFVFTPDQKLCYKPGQYMEWTLPHAHADSRGSRRYLTLASSPTESDIRIGVKFYERSSTFKKAMLDMDSKTTIIASQLAGDFVMPKDPTRKLAFIAGGIGVTPFRSMAKYLVDMNEQRDVVMLYGVRTEGDIAYADVFDEARKVIGMQTTYVLSGSKTAITRPDAVAGRIDTKVLKHAVPDYTDRIFYISGTHDMVVAIQETLINMGVHHRNIKVDYFSGYA
ncbi:MAG: RnfABCDGE type electron transport complex subunit D [Candidatus Saccharibacteria bacterium]